MYGRIGERVIWRGRARDGGGRRGNVGVTTDSREIGRSVVSLTYSRTHNTHTHTHSIHVGPIDFRAVGCMLNH